MFQEVSFAPQYTSDQKTHTMAIFKQACKLLTCFVHRDTNVLRFWSNVSEDAYGNLTSTMTEHKILSRLTQEPTHIGPTKLEEMITNLNIYIPHPNENVSKSRFDFDTEHVSTYPDSKISIAIYIHPNIFDLNVNTPGNS